MTLMIRTGIRGTLRLPCPSTPLTYHSTAMDEPWGLHKGGYLRRKGHILEISDTEHDVHIYFILICAQAVDGQHFRLNHQCVALGKLLHDLSNELNINQNHKKCMLI